MQDKGNFIIANATTKDGNLTSTGGVGVNVGGVGAYEVNTSSIGRSGLSTTHDTGFQAGSFASNQTEHVSYGRDGYQESRSAEISLGGQEILGEQSNFRVDAHGIHGIHGDYKLSVGGETVNCTKCIPDVCSGIANAARSVFGFFRHASCCDRDVLNQVVHTGRDVLGQVDLDTIGQVVRGAGELVIGVGEVVGEVLGGLDL